MLYSLNSQPGWRHFAGGHDMITPACAEAGGRAADRARPAWFPDGPGGNGHEPL